MGKRSLILLHLKLNGGIQMAGLATLAFLLSPLLLAWLTGRGGEWLMATLPLAPFFYFFCHIAIHGRMPRLNWSLQREQAPPILKPADKPLAFVMAVAVGAVAAAGAVSTHTVGS